MSEGWRVGRSNRKKKEKRIIARRYTIHIFTLDIVQLILDALLCVDAAVSRLKDTELCKQWQELRRSNAIQCWI